MWRKEPDKRQSPRVEVQLKVDLRTKYIYTTASVLNISRSGLFIKTLNPLPEGSEVDVIMHTGSREAPGHFRGVVRWGSKIQRGSVPPGMGLQFIKPDEKLLEDLAAEINRAPKSL